MHYWILAIICHVRCGISTSFLSPTFPIGGIFETFQVKDKSLQYLRQEVASQYLAAFVMAIDEINAKRDGYFDDILPNTKLRMITVIGVNISVSYPLNDFIGGAGRAYLLRNRDSSLVAVVDTAVRDLMAAATAQTLNYWGILNLMSRSTSNTYAHGEFFPLTLQNAPPETAEAAALVDLIFFNYNWRYVTVVHSYDTQTGLDSFAGFMAAAASVDLTVISVLRVSSSETDFSGIINSGIASGAKIFVLLTGGTEAGRLLEQGYNLGLFHEGTQVFITSISNIADIRSSFTTAGLANEAKILEGLISTAPFPERYFSTPQGQSFITRFRNLPPTITTDPITKKKICNKRTDGGRLPAYIYRATAVAAIKGIVNESILCLGFESFKSFNQNGSNIDPYTMYVYDAVYAYALAVDALLNNQTSVYSQSVAPRARDSYTSYERNPSMKPAASTIFTITARELRATMTSHNTKYPNIATGPMSFSDMGIRNRGNVYKVLNYQASQASNWYSAGGLAFIGETMDSSGWLLCGNIDQMMMMSSMSSTQCSNPQYRTPSGDVPPDDNLPVIYEPLSSLYRDPLIFFASLALFNLTVSAIYLFVNWNERHIKRSQPILHIIVLIGAYLGVFKVLLSVSQISRPNCVAQLWLQHLSFRLIVRTLLLKLWRVFVIVNSNINSSRCIGIETILSYITIDMVVLIILLAAVTGTTDGSYMTIIDSSTDDSFIGTNNHLVSAIMSTNNNQVTVEMFCSSPSRGTVASQLYNAILSIDSIYLLSAVFYLIRTRDLPPTIRAAGSTGRG